MKWFIILMILLLQMLTYYKVTSVAPMIRYSSTKEDESSTIEDIFVSLLNLGSVSNSTMIFQFAFKVQGLTQTDLSYRIWGNFKVEGFNKFNFFFYFKKGLVNVAYYEYGGPSGGSGTYSAMSLDQWYYGEVILDNSASCSITLNVYDHYDKGTTICTVTSGALGYGVAGTGTITWSSSAYFGNMDTNDLINVLHGNWLYRQNDGSGESAPSQIQLTPDTYWEPLFTAIHTGVSRQKIISMYDDGSIFFYYQEILEVNNEVSLSQTAQDNETAVTWSALQTHINVIAGNLDKILTLPGGDLSFPEPYKVISDGLNYFYDSLMKIGLEGITDAMIDALKSAMMSVANLIDKIQLVGQAVIEAGVEDLVDWFVDLFVPVVRTIMEQRISEIITWIGTHILSSAALEIFGDSIMSKIGAKGAVDASVKRVLEVVRDYIGKISIELY